jgi:CRP-like cAMP-binding protein
MTARPPYPRASNCFSCPVRGLTEWADLAEDDLRQLNQARISNTYELGQTIFYQGNPCLGIHCLESGLVALRKTDARGNSVIARLFHEGQTMGYLAYFGGRGYTGTAEALTSCRVCFIDRAAVRAILERNPAVGHRFLGRIADNLQEAEDKRLQAVGLPLRAQVSHLLLVLKDRFATVAEDGSLTLDLPLARRDVAAMLGARPESLSRAIRQLSDAGVARFEGRRVTIPDLDALIDEVEF